MRAKQLIESLLNRAIQESPIIDLDYGHISDKGRLQLDKFEYGPGVYGGKPGIAVVAPYGGSAANINQIVWLPDELADWAQHHMGIQGGWYKLGAIKALLAERLSGAELKKFTDALVAATDSVLSRHARLSAIAVRAPTNMADTPIMRVNTELTEVEALELAHSLGLTIQFGTTIHDVIAAAAASAPDRALKRYKVMSADFLAAGNDKPTPLNLVVLGTEDQQAKFQRRLMTAPAAEA